MTKMRNIMKSFLSILLVVGLIFTSTLYTTTKASAAGQGYSDPFRRYTLLGVNKNPAFNASAMMYGNANNKPADNQVVVITADVKNVMISIDVMNGEQFNAFMLTCLQSTQVEISTYNEYLLSQGAPDEYLYLEEKPYFVVELEKALAAKQTAPIIKNCSFVLPEALQYAAKAGGSNFRIIFDTMDGNAVDTRITIDPSKMTKGFSPLSGAYGDGPDPVIEKFARTYSNKFAHVFFMQKGSFGTTVQVATRVNLSGLNTSSLLFYSYDWFANQYTVIENPNYSIDEYGYLHFSTSMGGSILITDQPLTAK